MMDKISTEDWIEYKSNAIKILSRNNQDETSNAVQIAIDKQIPKKLEEKPLSTKYDYFNVYNCPNCHTYLFCGVREILGHPALPKYCYRCGQALDWKE